MDAEKALADVEACCPCRSGTPCYLAGSALKQTKQSCACGSHKLKQPDDWRILDPVPCRWPGHSCARTLARAAFEVGVEWRDRDLAEIDITPLPKWLTETSR